MSDTQAVNQRIGASLDIRFADSVAEFARFLTDHGLNHIELRWGYLDRHGIPAHERLHELAETVDLTFTVHAPHVDCALGNVNERLRRAAVAETKEAIDLAAAIDAGGVIVHGGSARKRYPESVRHHVREQAIRSLRECVEYADRHQIPLCLENQAETDTKWRHTATPDSLANFLTDIGVETEYLRLTLDIGHAKATGIDYQQFVDRFGDRIHVVHLHDNDGEDDQHDPLPSFRSVVADVDAQYNILEMKSHEDIDQCVAG